MLRSHHLDGFELFSGLVAVIAGPIILVTGTLAPGWAVFITVAGAIVLWAQWRVAGDDGNDDAPPKVPVLDQSAANAVREDAIADTPVAVGNVRE